MTTTLVTGATRGLGKETARQLVAAGHTVWIGARDLAVGSRVAEELGARAVQLDVRDDDSVTAAFATVSAAGGLDVLVNNAGIGAVARSGPEALEVFDTNAVGIVRTTEAENPQGRPVAVSAATVAAVADAGAQAPTGVLLEDGAPLGW